MATSHEWTETTQDADYVGNNAAFTCPKCSKVFLVSAALHPDPDGKQGHDGSRPCQCGRSVAHVAGGRKSGGTAWIEVEE